MTTDEVRSLFDRVLGWSPEQQQLLAHVAEAIEAQRYDGAREDPATKAAIAEGLAQASRGEFASGEDVAKAFARFRQ